MQKCLFIVFSLFVIFRELNCDGGWDLKEDRGEWIDPHSFDDPVSVRPPPQEKQTESGTCDRSDCDAVERNLTKCSKKMEKLEKDLEEEKRMTKKCNQPITREQPFFEQLVRHILQLFKNHQDDMKQGHYEASISLSPHSYAYLSDYVTGKNVSIQEVHVILSKLMTDVRWIHEKTDSDEFDAGSGFSWSSAFVYYLDVSFKVAMIVGVSLSSIRMVSSIRMPLSRLLFFAFTVGILLSFCVSVPWTWWHLYKKKVAERMAHLARGQPDCANRMSSFWRTLYSSVFIVGTDECTRYYEQLEIDPLWEVTPTQALSVTLVRFLVDPAKYFGAAIRDFMLSAFEGLPMMLWLPVFVFIIVLILLLLFCIGQYSISTPLLTIGPSRGDVRKVNALEQDVNQLKALNQELHLRLEQRRDRPAIDERGDRAHHTTSPNEGTLEVLYTRQKESSGWRQLPEGQMPRSGPATVKSEVDEIESKSGSVAGKKSRGMKLEGREEESLPTQMTHISVKKEPSTFIAVSRQDKPVVVKSEEPTVSSKFISTQEMHLENRKSEEKKSEEKKSEEKKSEEKKSEEKKSEEKKSEEAPKFEMLDVQEMPRVLETEQPSVEIAVKNQVKVEEHLRQQPEEKVEDFNLSKAGLLPVGSGTEQNSEQNTPVDGNQQAASGTKGDPNDNLVHDFVLLDS